ncbi:phosphoglycerate dehydrogenase [Anaerofustis sp.]|uniref:phosphoglycerate dehydrogenase n=1 Tax=Anaerofustis sp. TaxID=1872517 RepID=UPI0025C5FA82|nr:phosphoglycerate dehydrogenase [Anaerofustis sp.]
MYKIKTFNKIAKEGLNLLGENVKVEDNDNYDGIILRSYNLNDENISDSCKVIARAGAGYNNVPVEQCTEKGVVVMNTPGANANAVKELVLCAFLLAARNVTKGANWIQTLDKNDDVAKIVEKEKSNFKGNELLGKKVGVIGLGAIGVLVANALDALGMEVYGYDPYLSVEHAWSINKNINRSYDLERIFQRCDFVTIHVPLMDSTKDTVNKELLSKAKDNIKIINLARGGLVNDDAILEAVESGKVACYVTDFPNEKLLGNENIICIPHLGASTPESETNCAVMAARQVREYLENGNIKNSVNFPECDLGQMASKARICIIHKNIPNMVGQFSSLLASNDVNIANMINKSKGENAYTMIDIDSDVSEYTENTLKEVKGIISVRVLHND